MQASDLGHARFFVGLVVFACIQRQACYRDAAWNELDATPATLIQAHGVDFPNLPPLDYKRILPSRPVAIALTVMACALLLIFMNSGTGPAQDLVAHEWPQTDYMTRTQLKAWVAEYASHGSDVTDQDVEDVLKAIKSADEATFIDMMLELTEREAREVQDDPDGFFVCHAMHDRNDVFAGSVAPNLRGKTVKAAFCGKILFRNFGSYMDQLPSHVAVSSKDILAKWAQSITPEAEVPEFHIEGANGSPYPCVIEDPAARQKIKDAVSTINWNAVAIEVYGAVPQAGNGSVFSPGLNSIWIVRTRPGGSCLLWFAQAAKSNGEPTGGIFGTSFDEPVMTRALTRSTPLSSAKNFQRITMSDKPLTQTIECFYHDHDANMTCPYLVVTSVWDPAKESEIQEMCGDTDWQIQRKAAMRKAVNVIVTGALMQRLYAEYFQEARVQRLFFAEGDLAYRNVEEAMRAGFSKQAASMKVPLSRELKVAGPLLKLFCDYPNWHKALWVCVPEAEVSKTGVGSNSATAAAGAGEARRRLSVRRSNSHVMDV